MNRNYINVDKKYGVLKCKEIKPKEVDNVMNGNRDVRLVVKLGYTQVFL